MDNRKIILSGYLASAMVVWFLLRATLQYLFLTFYQFRRFPGASAVREFLPLLTAIVAFLVLLKHPRINQVMDEVVAELKKVTWPNREDVYKSTTVVLICIAFASAVLAFFDLLWGKLIGMLLYG